MFNKFVIIFIVFLFVLSCKKEDTKSNSTYLYKLNGWFLRDTAIKSNGLKGINFSADANYCWLNQINSKDSLRCFGKYQQTSDSTLLWDNTTTINYKIYIVDEEAKLAKIVVATLPASNPLFGNYTNP